MTGTKARTGVFPEICAANRKWTYVETKPSPGLSQKRLEQEAMLLCLLAWAVPGS